VQKFIFLLTLISPALANAVPPPPAQLTADCEAPTYASDMLVCVDAGLRELDLLLAMRIGQREESVADASGNESDQDWFRRSRLCAFETDHRECLVEAYCLRLALIDRSEVINHVECQDASRPEHGTSIFPGHSPGAETRPVNPRRKKGILTSPAKSASMNEVTSSW
jgi:uncharacterized protein